MFDVTPLCLCDNNWSQWQTANYKLKVTKITTRIPGESTHRGAITIQARRYSNDIGGERRIMTTENSATTVATRMKWNLILKQAFDHRCCMLATFAIVAAANVDCNSVDVASERASLAFLPKFCVWEGRCCCCCCSYSKTTTTHPMKIVCNLQVSAGDSYTHTCTLTQKNW